MDDIEKRLAGLKELANRFLTEIAEIEGLLGKSKFETEAKSSGELKPLAFASYEDWALFASERDVGRHYYNLIRRSLPPTDALMSIFTYYGGAAKRSEWSGEMVEAGFSEQIATRARAKLISMGVLEGHHGNYRLTEIGRFYELVCGMKQGRELDDEQRVQLEEYERKYGKIFEY